MTEEIKDLTKEREERCAPIAVKILGLIGNSNPVVGDIAMQELTKNYKELAKKVIELFVEANISIEEINYIFQLVRQAPEALQSVITDTFTSHLETVQKKKIGCVLGEIKMKDLQVMLEGDTLK